MSLTHRFNCPLANGVHARPASALEAVARGFAATVAMINERTGHAANAKSVLSLVGADIRHQDACALQVSGPDEQTAFPELVTFLTEVFPHCDDALPTVVKSNRTVQLPPSFRSDGVALLLGTPVVPGIGQGRIVQIGKFRIPAAIPTDNAADSSVELHALEKALPQLSAWYDQRIAATAKGVERELLDAHRAMARDPELRHLLTEAVLKNHRTAAGAIADAEAHLSAMLTASGSTLLRERALDIQDICIQLLKLIYGPAAVAADFQLTEDAIVAAEALTPGQFLGLARKFFKGLVLAQAGTTSHTVILARSFGIPTLAGVEHLASAKFEGQDAVVDAEAGALVTNLTEATRGYYVLEQRRFGERQKRVSQFVAQPAATRDGHRLEVDANLAIADEAARAFAAGAEGIGLFRTEMLFLDRESAPDEQEQFEAYRTVLLAAGDKPVVIRTLDIGGDKPLDYLKLPAEENPFLGYRALRIYPEFEALFRTQIRALVRASAQGRLKLLLPMVAIVDEVRWTKKIIAEEQAKCAAEGIPFDRTMPVGAMIEVPAAALILKELCAELDFFNIGSNDLLQYFMAADRANPRVAGLFNDLQPGFLRFLKQIVEGIHEHKKEVCLCGEMGGQPRLLPLLAGLGLDSISCATPAIANLKPALAQLILPDCQHLLNAALGCATNDEVSRLLDEFAGTTCAPLLDPELILMDAESGSKEEAVKLAVDRLYVLGRTDEPHAIAEAVWQREATYSTAFGHGFAVPHCKSNAVQSNSLVLVKLHTPVTWNTGEPPVRVVILLAIREKNGAMEHLKVLSRLARQIMHEEFRQRIENETSADALCALLRDTLQTEPGHTTTSSKTNLAPTAS
jgi:phosphoenolpyruvate-protein phosphotransferase